MACQPRIHCPKSFQLGFLPCVRIPILYIRAAIQVVAMNVAIRMMKETISSQFSTP